MSQSTAELVDQLADVERRNAAREQLVSLGAQATPFLLRAAATPRNPEHSKTILRTLLLIRDSQAQHLFRQALASDDAEVRALGARGLYLVKAPDALSGLRETINDSPDPLHWERTPAADSLIEMGSAALPTVFVLMDSPNEETRRRAQYVLATVVLRDITLRLQPRPLTGGALQELEHLQHANGSYQWDGNESARKSSVELWKRWYAGLHSAG
jgi:hypothetical protein